MIDTLHVNYTVSVTWKDEDLIYALTYRDICYKHYTKSVIDELLFLINYNTTMRKLLPHWYVWYWKATANSDSSTFKAQQESQWIHVWEINLMEREIADIKNKYWWALSNMMIDVNYWLQFIDLWYWNHTITFKYWNSIESGRENLLPNESWWRKLSQWAPSVMINIEYEIPLYNHWSYQIRDWKILKSAIVDFSR